MGLLDSVSAFAFDEISRSIMQESKQWMAINLQHIVVSGALSSATVVKCRLLYTRIGVCPPTSQVL